MSLAKLKYFFLRAYMQHMGRCSPGHKPVDLKQVERIGLWQFGGVGDMLLATPVIEALAVACPAARIHVWCSEPRFAEFLYRFPQVEAVHALDIYTMDARTLLTAERRQKLYRLRDALRTQQLDMLINLHVPAMLDWWAVGWWLAHHSGSRYMLGFDPDFISHGSIYDVSVPSIEREGIHYTSLYQRLLAKAGIACGTDTCFPVSESEQQQAGELLKTCGVDASRPWVCLHAGARRLSMIGRQWPASRFAELANHLQMKGIRTLLIGVPCEQSLADEIMRLSPDTCSLLGQTDLGVMAAVIARCHAFVGQDSGPFHVAVSQHIPAIALCGREDAEPHYLAYEQSNAHALIRPKPDLISVDDVLQQLALCLPELSSGSMHA